MAISTKTVLGLFSYGGLEEVTIDCVLGELSRASAEHRMVAYHRISGDALIERSRSRALGKFMQSDADCIVMIDHDMEWRPGDMLHVADAAVEQSSLVGGLYCKRAFGRGWSSRVPINGQVEFGKPGLIETPALATGFMAIPRKVVEGVQAKLDITKPYFQNQWKLAFESGDHDQLKKLQDLSIAPIADGAYREIEFEYHDYFRCIRADSSIPGCYQFLSEDWAFAVRAGWCGYKSYISTYPLLAHHGIYGYKIPDGMDVKDKELANGAQCNSEHNNKPGEGAGGDSGPVCK